MTIDTASFELIASVIAIILGSVSIVLVYTRLVIGWNNVKNGVDNNTRDILGIKKETGELREKTDKTSSQVIELNTKMELFWEAVAQKVTGMLHSPHASRRDELIKKLASKTMTVHEACELEALLDVSAREKEFTGTKELGYVLVSSMLHAIAHSRNGSEPLLMQEIKQGSSVMTGHVEKNDA